MDRFLAHVRSQSLFLLSPRRRLSSFKWNSNIIVISTDRREKQPTFSSSVDLVESSYLNGQKNPIVPSLVVDTTYPSIRKPNPYFPLPGRIGLDFQTKPTGTQSEPKLDPNQYGIDTKTLLDEVVNQRRYFT